MTVVAVGIGVNWHVTNIGWQQQPSVYLRRVCVCSVSDLSQRCRVWPHYRFSGDCQMCSGWFVVFLCLLCTHYYRRC